MRNNANNKSEEVMYRPNRFFEYNTRYRTAFHRSTHLYFDIDHLRSNLRWCRCKISFNYYILLTVISI